MRSRVVIAALVCSGAMAATAPAAAECALPHAALFPASGTPLPAMPVLYLFRPQRSRITAEADARVSVRDAVTGAVIDVTPRRVDRSVGLEVWAVYVPAVERLIDVSGPGFPSARYRVGGQMGAGRRRAAIEGVAYESRHWPCSYTEAVTVTGRGNPAAFRLEWLEGDEVRAAYLPPSMDALWRWDDATVVERLGASISEIVAPPVNLTIGHQSCLGHTVDPEVLAREREMRLVAVFADGSREPIGAAPIRVDRIGMTVPRALVGASIDRRPLPIAPIWTSGPPAPVALAVATPWRGRAIAGLLLVAAVVAGALTCRRARAVTL
jgi:hypothetical protein